MTSFAVSSAPSSARTDTSKSPALVWFNTIQSGNPGVRARLRRCRSTVEAMLEPSSIQLATQLGVLSPRARGDDARVQAALDLARVLAHVKVHEPSQRLMQSAGWKEFPGDRKESDAGDARPVLSEARFRRLLTTEGGEPLVAAFVRLVRQLDGTVNVIELANDFLNWTKPSYAAGIRRKWAFDYYAAGVAAPSAIDHSTSNEDNL